MQMHSLNHHDYTFASAISDSFVPFRLRFCFVRYRANSFIVQQRKLLEGGSARYR